MDESMGQGIFILLALFLTFGLTIFFAKLKRKK
jgi:hypothetical protein